MRDDVTFKPVGSALAGERLENPDRLRAKICLCLLLLGFITISIRLVTVQIFEHKFWTDYVEDQRESSVTIYPKRGTIYDRNDVPLAASIVQEVLCVAPRRVADPLALAKILAKYTNKSVDKIVDKITNTSLHLVYLERGFDFKTANEIRALRLPGVEFRSEPSRHYPKSPLASNVLGFSNVENRGLEGLEHEFDKRLAGEIGKQIVIKDISRRQLGALTTTVKESSDGDSIVLTLDEGIQYSTEKALDGIIDEYSPESAMAVVLAPKTGEVLALACRPTFDPNNPSTFTTGRLRNRAVTDVFEPGSSFKPVAAAAALECKVISPEDRVYCERGSMRIHGHTFNDVHPLAEVTFIQVMAESSNIGMIKTVSMLQPQRLYEYIKAFGFGDLTGIELPGEIPGIVHPPSRWSGLSMASMTIGQEIGVTALQLCTAFSTIANGGVLMRPYAVSEVKDPSGAIIEENGPQVIRRVMQPETARQLTHMLERVVDSGTGKAAKIKGYRCAGKTGTAQKPDLKNGGYHRDKYVSVFAGFVPADDPVACIVVVADSPKGKYYGGQVAAPAFKEIAQSILNRYEIAPSAPEEQVPAKSTPPSRVAKSIKPDSEAGGTIIIDENGLLRMPDVRGMTMQSIMKMLKPYVDRFEFTGSGVAYQQTPAPNEPITSGRVCRIAFRRIDEK